MDRKRSKKLEDESHFLYFEYCLAVQESNKQEGKLVFYFNNSIFRETEMFKMNGNY